MDLLDIDKLKHDFSGEIILPGDSSYDQVSTTFATKGAPAIVIKPHTVKDVSLAIRYARDNKLLLSIRSGGHSVAGFSTNTGGMVIDLTSMCKVELKDSEKHIVQIGAGAKWGEVAKALQEHGLAISSGDTLTVGVGGLILGGGIGWMVRKYGLAIDSLLSAEIVTAQGEILLVSETENPDLFWAIRGGGGNFGVVTHFTFAAHPSRDVYAGTIYYGLDNVAELLKGWRNHLRAADEALTTIINIIPSFGGNPPVFMLTCCYAGDDEKAAMSAIEPLKQLGNLVKEDIKRKPYAEVLEEAHQPPGVKIIVKNVFAKTLSDELIQAVVAARDKKKDMIVQIRGLGGAMKRIASDATAFSYRDSEVLLLSPTFVPPTASESEVEEALKPWEMLASFGTGSYVNFLSDTSENIVAIYPKGTYDRLAEIKKRYDPENMFNQNYNIKSH